MTLDRVVVDLAGAFAPGGWWVGGGVGSACRLFPSTILPANTHSPPTHTLRCCRPGLRRAQPRQQHRGPADCGVTQPAAAPAQARPTGGAGKRRGAGRLGAKGVSRARGAAPPASPDRRQARSLCVISPIFSSAHSRQFYRAHEHGDRWDREALTGDGDRGAFPLEVRCACCAGCCA